MNNPIKLFQGLLAFRHLIKEAIEEDYYIIHYITYLGNGELYEVTFGAQTTVEDPKMIWAHKFIIPFTKLHKLMKLCEKMIQTYDKKGLKLS